MSDTTRRAAFIAKQLKKSLTETLNQEQRIASYLSELRGLGLTADEAKQSELVAVASQLRRYAVTKATRSVANELLTCWGLQQGSEAAAAAADAVTALPAETAAGRKRKFDDSGIEVGDSSCLANKRRRREEDGVEREKERKRERDKRRDEKGAERERRVKEKEGEMEGEEKEKEKDRERERDREKEKEKDREGQKEKEREKDREVENEKEKEKKQKKEKKREKKEKDREREEKEKESKSQVTSQQQQNAKASSSSSSAGTATALGYDNDAGLREKCRQMIESALQLGDSSSSSSSKRAAELSHSIEASIFTACSSRTDGKYRNRIRSRLLNLRDPKNPTLRQLLLQGQLAPEQLAAMTPEQLASEEMRQLRRRLAEEAIEDSKMAVALPGSSSLFSCKRCKKHSCTYHQLQTLSGDEPMTTYVFCNECGFRWKFN